MKKNLIFIILFFLSTNLFAEKKGMMLENLTSQEKTYNNVQDLNNLGVNIVRLPFYSDKTADEYASQLFNLATKFKHITIVSDFHWTNLNLCKNSTTDRISNNIEIILDRTCRDSFFNFWEIVSKKTGHLKNIWFDLLNEPNPKMNWKKWQPIFIKAAKIIRKNSKNKIVVPITGAGCRRLKNFGKLPKISNQILTCHFYNFGNWHYDNSDYPKNAKNKIKEVLLDFKNKYKDIYVGETAAYYANPNADKYLKEFTEVCQNLKIPLTVHAFRESDFFNYENNYNAWKVLTSWFAR